jgi:hypothetical protein
MKGVIGDVIRNTRIQDSSWISDTHEWIYQAMAQMETEFSLESKWEVLKVRFHKQKLPCGLQDIDAVEYLGSRLKENKPSRPASKQTSVGSKVNLNMWETSINKIEPVTDHKLYNTVLTNVEQLPLNLKDYYYTELGFINTSFEEGEVTVYFKAIPVDADDMPLIPDNVNYRLALYWYCRAMMIGAGYDDRQFTFEYCMQMFEKQYAPRALAEIRLPSPEQMEHRVDNFQRFIPHAGYYESFFQTDQPERFIDTKYRP